MHRIKRGSDRGTSSFNVPYFPDNVSEELKHRRVNETALTAKSSHSGTVDPISRPESEKGSIVSISIRCPIECRHFYSEIIHR
jgi:hypothetical protein